MFSTFLIPLLSLPLVLTRPLSPPNCSNVHIFLARGTGEEYPGFPDLTSTSICSTISPALTCSSSSIHYRNYLDSTYCDSVQVGISRMGQQVTAYNTHCPDTLLVLIGYSMGAQVVGDALAGVTAGNRSSTLAECVVPEIAPTIAAGSKAAERIAAAVLYADPRHNKGAAFNDVDTLAPWGKQGAFYDGQVPRDEAELERLQQYSKRILSLCNYADPICAASSQPNALNWTMHHDAAYRGKQFEDAVAFVLEKVYDAYTGLRKLEPEAEREESDSSSTCLSSSSDSDSSSSEGSESVESTEESSEEDAEKWWERYEKLPIG
ncbi:alpha/beta-hydrolase [Ascobolus immersus RN42]|uniref:Alpha/beta-hydrolase n=1 Tax=Ascobolus immersus RN42 TaxID=1160509 RepID=A0A3N4IHK3_ASCIM|nr:alpha/beta-hydrolase [Ascobolus immersus RN42]